MDFLGSVDHRVKIGAMLALLIAVVVWWRRPRNDQDQSCGRACASAERVAAAVALSDGDEAGARLLGPLADRCAARCRTERWSSEARQCLESANDVDEIRRCRRLIGNAEP